MDLNYESIQENYPKVFALLGMDKELWYIYNTRNLYDFFDAYKINVFIYPYDNEGGGCVWQIWENGEFENETPEIFSSRTEAEVDAFTEAFVMLENRL